MRRIDVPPLLTFVWPQVQAVFPRYSGKLLMSAPTTRCGAAALPRVNRSS